jgi:hypothetical protein
MLRPLTQNLYLAASAVDVSQPVALGRAVQNNFETNQTRLVLIRSA